jgi:hypothetical protein
MLRWRPFPWWRAALIGLRGPVWPASVAALLGIGLLLAFQQVVARSVEQADQQRVAAAAQHEGVWRCKLLRQPGSRANCLLQVAGAHESASLHQRDVLAATGPTRPSNPEAATRP